MTLVKVLCVLLSYYIGQLMVLIKATSWQLCILKRMKRQISVRSEDWRNLLHGGVHMSREMYLSWDFVEFNYNLDFFLVFFFLLLMEGKGRSQSAGH